MAISVRPCGTPLANLEREQASLRAAPDKSALPIRMHPRVAELYAEKVAGLEEALNDEAIRSEAAELRRSLITRVELRPGTDHDRLDAMLYGDPARIMTMCDEDDHKSKLSGAGVPRSLLSVVAGARIGRERHSLIVPI